MSFFFFFPRPLFPRKVLWEIIGFYGWRDKAGQINQYKANESKLNLLKQNYWVEKKKKEKESAKRNITHRVVAADN